MKRLSTKLKHEIATTLTIVDKKLPKLNHGGCGVFAILLGEHLVKFGLNIKYHYVLRYKEDIKIANEAVNNRDWWDLQCTSWTHIVISINDRYYVDSTGIYKKKLDLISRHIVTNPNKAKITMGVPKELLETHIDNEDLWNDVFNRKREIPKIKRILATKLEKNNK
jgi:hypothetical protein